MTDRTYVTAPGGLPPQTQIMTDRAVFTEAYAVIPRGTLRDIVTSFLPFWTGARFWVLARPMTGFSETFSQYIGELAPGGGSNRPETDAGVESALFVVSGTVTLTLDGIEHVLQPGAFAFVPPNHDWALFNTGDSTAQFHWIRKRYQAVEGLALPDPIITCDQDVAPAVMPDCDGAWATTRFFDPEDLRHDMHVTIVTLQPGGVIPFAETHVMEHGLFVLQGKGVYRLNTDWVEVESGDFMWLRAFCPQACYAGGPEPFRYLLYKDVNRHAGLSL
jgi:(S)-ureidoglycine aminohydrolase